MALKTNLMTSPVVTEKVGTKLRALIIGLTALTLVLMVGLLGFTMNILFIRPFLRILGFLDKSAVGLDIESEKVPSPGYIAENRKLVRAIKEFIQRVRNSELLLLNSQNMLKESEKRAALGELSRQVAHDIRSPLTALNLIMKSDIGLPEAHGNLLVAAVARINSIANDLLSKSKNSMPGHASKEFVEDMSLNVALDQIVDEKRLIAQQAGVVLAVDFATLDSKASTRLSTGVLQNIVSNVIANAIEASPRGSKIKITSKQSTKELTVTVTDSGIGIPAEVLSEIGTREITYGKANGNGLGLLNAHRVLSECGGQLIVSSSSAHGTMVQICVPFGRTSLPPKKIEKISLHDDTEVVVVDDDSSMHELWRHRLSEFSADRTILMAHQVKPEMFSQWFEKLPDDRRRRMKFFVDYQFSNSTINGLELIKRHGIQSSSVLVTSHDSDSVVMRDAEVMGVVTLAKSRLGTFPIEFSRSGTH